MISKRIIKQMVPVFFGVLCFLAIACSSSPKPAAVQDAEPAVLTAEAPMTGVAVQAESVYVSDTIYQIKDGYDSIQEWNSRYCSVSDKKFSCKASCRVSPSVCIDPYNQGLCVVRDTVRDTVRIQLNYGDNPVVDYIPYAAIPEFKRDSMQARFAEMKGTSCASLVRIKSNYYLEAIGLPEGLLWYEISSGKWGEEDIYAVDPFKDVYLHLGLDSLVEARDSLGNISACKFSTISADADPPSPFDCDVPTLPEEPIEKSYKLVNTAVTAFADTTIQWKLVYKDQYGRGDTLDMTTHFTIPEYGDPHL